MTVAKVNGLSPKYQIKSNNGKKACTGLGACAGAAYIAKDTKELRAYIGRNFDKIHANHPNIKNRFTDIFKSYLKTTKISSQNLNLAEHPIGSINKGIKFDAEGLLKQNKRFAGIMFGGIMAGLAVGTIIDNIKHANETKKALSKVG